jgi:plasmid stabilization system protein ParE
VTYTLRFLEEVEDDAHSASTWYEERHTGLGDEFLEAFFESARQITAGPLLYEEVHGDIRRRLMRRFPYAIYFMMEEANIIIVGLFHCARDPRTIESEVATRSV